MTPNEIEALVEAKVRVVLAQLLGPLITQQPQPQAEWLDLKDAFALLGFPSQKALRDAIRDGLLRQGHEVRDRRKPGAQNARYQVNVELSQKRLNAQPDKRRPV